MNPMNQMIKISTIRLDGGTQIRAAKDYSTIKEYAAAMEGGAIFPPLVVFQDGPECWLADGFHRVEAAMLAGREEINAEVHAGTLREAQLFSVAANQTHGLRRTNADKRRAVAFLLADPEWCQWSNREIARQCGVSPGLVDGMRSKVVPIIGTPWLPEPGFMVTGKAEMNDGTLRKVFIVSSVPWDGRNDWFYVMVFVVGNGEEGSQCFMDGLTRPIRRDFVADVLGTMAFPVDAARWEAATPLGNEPDTDENDFSNCWSWPHLLYSSREEWMEKRWARKVPA
jgi:hypothetical protein